MEFTRIIAEYKPELERLYAELHRGPELSGEEYETTRVLRAYLKDIGANIIECGLETGVAALLPGDKPGPAIALRADIDALPVTEDPQHALRSLHEGRMHACGHDIHMTALMGAAMALAARRERGDVLLLFQPAEETVEGARRMIGAGIFVRHPVQAIFGLHVWPSIPAGSVGIKSGAIMAAKDSFLITVRGRGGHGASPHDAADPILAGATVIQALQSVVSRSIAPIDAAALSVCSVHAEGGDNIIPERLIMRGSMRTCSDATRALVRRRLEAIAKDVASAYGCKADVEYTGGTAATVNDAGLYAIAARSAELVFGKEHIVEPPLTMTSEDFSEYARIAPSFLYFLGVGRAEIQVPLHHPSFQPDSSAFLHGAALFAATAEQGQCLGML